MTQRWAYLGPEGTFTEQAVWSIRQRSPQLAVQPIAADGVSAALQAVRLGDADAACVPLENSVEGGVPLTQDELAGGDPLIITAEAFVPITFHLLVRPGTTLERVTSVGSHPHGHAQVREWLAVQLPGTEVVVTSSTAAAAAAVAAGDLDAAAAAPVAGERLGLVAIAQDIGVVRNATTRFVLLRRPGPPPDPTGNDRTSLILSVRNEPGALLDVLAEIAGRGINLTRLESRPTRSKLGEYVFHIDADGHIAEPAMADMVATLIRRSVMKRWLGSYPRMSGSVVPLPDFATRTAYDNAGRGLSSLLSGEDEERG